jgi:HlyD family secretion protein
LNLVEDRLSKTKIMAPFDCTVLTRPVSVGQAVSGSGGFNSGTEVMTIANLNEMIITAHVNQSDVTRLKDKQVVDIQVESVPGLKMKGTIERIAPQATIRNNLKGFDARIVIRKIDSRVRPGMTANLSIPVVSTLDTLAVPIAAIFSEANSETAPGTPQKKKSRKSTRASAGGTNRVSASAGPGPR